ncbi:MAG: hypothetical protein QOJ35_3980 [Solirubrobacteraceae bacterium]|nr:hypothetical protein [Solirubrobacteraceae bacterium]
MRREIAILRRHAPRPIVLVIVISFLVDAVRLGNDVKQKWDALAEEQQTQLRGEFEAFQGHLKDATGAMGCTVVDTAGVATDWTRDRFDRVVAFGRGVRQDQERANATDALSEAQAQIAALRSAAAELPNLRPEPVAVVLSAVLAHGGEIGEMDLAASVPSLDDDARDAGLGRAVSIGLVQLVKKRKSPTRIVVVGLATTGPTPMNLVRARLAETGRAALRDLGAHSRLQPIALRGAISGLIRDGQITWCGGEHVWLTDGILQDTLAAAEARAVAARAQLDALSRRRETTPPQRERAGSDDVDRELQAKATRLKASAKRLQEGISRVSAPPLEAVASPAALNPPPNRIPTAEDLATIEQLHAMRERDVIDATTYELSVKKILGT